MKIRRKTIAVLLIVGMFCSSCDYKQAINTKSQQEQKQVLSTELGELTVKQKLEDFNYMYDILEKNFPYFEIKKRRYGYDWLTHKKEFESWVKNTKNNEEFYSTMNKIVMLIQNAHTVILSQGDFEDYKEIYNQCDYKAWMDIVNDKTIEAKYKKWSKYTNNKDIEYAPIFFLYLEGEYIAFDKDLFKTKLSNFNIPEGSILKEINSQDVHSYMEHQMKKCIQLLIFT